MTLKRLINCCVVYNEIIKIIFFKLVIIDVVQLFPRDLVFDFILD